MSQKEDKKNDNMTEEGEAEMIVNLFSREFIASIDIDSQLGFTEECPDEMPVVGGLDIVTELNKQAEKVALRIGTKDAHPETAEWIATDPEQVMEPHDGEHADLKWPRHCISGTKGCELLPGLPHPTEYDFFIWKGVEPDMHPYGACYHDINQNLSTGLAEYLHFNGIKTVIVGGLALDFCVKETALQLIDLGFRVIVNIAATRGLDKHTVDQAISEMRDVGIEFVISSAEIIVED